MPAVTVSAPSASLNMEAQQYAVALHRRQQHEQWVQQHQQQLKWSHADSTARALILVNEAWRNERSHLKHQQDHCQKVLKRLRRGLPIRPLVGADEPELCACCKAPTHRRLTPKYRAMNLLQGRFEDSRVEQVVDAMRQTYNNDHDMLHDLLQRYGPEEPEADIALWLRSVDERLKNCDDRWQAIARGVQSDMRDGDNFPCVIRNLSIMRIFLEGSQAQHYCCDPYERSRRDVVHQQLLDRLQKTGRNLVVA